LLDKFSEERIIGVGMGFVPVSRVPSFVFGGLLARNELVDIDCILRVGNSELIGRRIFWFEVSSTSEILSQFDCDCWLFEKEED
jgi:hypothetical protein